MVHTRRPSAFPDAPDARPYWSQVLRALREARGMTQDGWAMQLGYGRSTVKRWETGEAVPAADAEAALLTLCREKGLFRDFAHGPLAGVCLTPEWLAGLLVEARLGFAAPPVPLSTASAPVVAAIRPEPFASPKGSAETVAATTDATAWAPPETQYARSGDLYIAYQVTGSGPIDIVMTPGFLSHVEFMWEHPAFARRWRQMASFCRLIRFDKRGQGLSDRVPDSQLPSLEERMDDVRAVMDAASSERAVLFGVSEGAPMSILFAATYPERVAALVLHGSFATRTKILSEEEHEQRLRAMAAQRGTASEMREFLHVFAPSVEDDPSVQQWFAKLRRLGATPSAQAALTRMNWAIDVARVLPTVRVPTLVLHQTGERAVPVAAGRYVAAHIPGARLVEFPGEDHIFEFGDQADAVYQEIRRFIATIEPAEEIEQVLATALVVGGDVPAARRPDFDAIVEREVGRYRGRPAATSEGSALATFDGPVRAIRCARAILVGARGLGIEARAGLHTGACEVGANRASGQAVRVAQRLAEAATNGEVLLTSGVEDLIAGSGIAVADRGARPLDGILGEWRLFVVR